MDFSDALKAIKEGKKVKRHSWGGYWFLNATDSTYAHEPFNGGLSNPGGFTDSKLMNSMIIACLKDDKGFAPAQPYMEDMLADDWEISKSEEAIKTEIEAKFMTILGETTGDPDYDVTFNHGFMTAAELLSEDYPEIKKLIENAKKKFNLPD